MFDEAKDPDELPLLLFVPTYFTLASAFEKLFRYSRVSSVVKLLSCILSAGPDMGGTAPPKWSSMSVSDEPEAAAGSWGN